MNASFGIDHPLIAVNDINALRDRLISIGFNMTPVGKHPWGTSTSLAMFQGCLLEIMGIYDATLIDEVPTGDFYFGRHVYEHLRQREGVALSALHSTALTEDAAIAEKAGFHVAGQLEFGRDVTLPDGSGGRTKTSLALLPNRTYPRLSLFLCQQHRPELIYVPSWMEHPNSVHGYAGVTVLAHRDDMARLVAQFSGLYGDPCSVDGGAAFETANGSIQLLTRSAVEALYGPLPTPVTDDGEPAIVAMTLKYSDSQNMEACLRASSVEFTRSGDAFRLSAARLFGNTFLNFVPG